MTTATNGIEWTVATQGYAAALHNTGASGNYNSGLLVQTTGTDTTTKILELESGGTAKMTVLGNGNVGIGTTSPAYKLEVSGSFAATTKSFVINHPTKAGMKLQHGVVEGPEHTIFVRGKTTSNIITLPEYWTGLIHEDTISVHLTSIGKHQNLVVTYVDIHEIKIENQNSWNTNINCYYIVQAERKDIPKLIVEY